MSLDFPDLEQFYETLATSLDVVPQDKREVFLCKLCLLMARELGDIAVAQQLIKAAQNHLLVSDIPEQVQQ